MQSKAELSGVEPRASIPLQTLLYFDTIFQFIFFFLEFVVFVFKGYGLFYPPNTIGIEIALLLAFLCAQVSRIMIGSAGNQTESLSSMIWFLIICLPVTLFYAYFLTRQTYVIVIETIINSIGLTFLGLEFIISIQTSFIYKDEPKTKQA